jgi:endonuclease V-like protein UPF0215 family
VVVRVPLSRARSFSHVIGVDDAPFARAHRGRVRIVGACLAGPRLEGVLSSFVRRDGADSTRAIAAMVVGSRFHAQCHALLLQGIAVAGFNVVDLAALADAIARPVLVIARRAPRMGVIRAALVERVSGGAAKWARIERAGPMEPCAGVMVQRAGLSLDDAARLIQASTIMGRIPEALRMAHLIAGGITDGHSRGRA